MRQSQLFTKTLRNPPKDEESKNAKLLIQAGFVHKEMAGVYSFLPLGLRVLRKIEAIIRSEMQKMGGQEVLMPSLHPKANWETTGRWESFDALLYTQSKVFKQEYALGPTHEEIVVPLAKQYISSYKDLPFSLFQIQNKFRDEKRAKSGLLRGKEFLMKDLYSFHASENDMEATYEKMKGAYERIFSVMGIGEKTYLTFASGGTFSQYSHEFQTLAEAGEDEIFICENCKVAVNKEIIEKQSSCPQCGNAKLRKENAVEIGNIFLLKDKFSKAFELTFKDTDGKEKLVLMGCYGIGLSRVMGTVVEVSHDTKGIVWPESIAPFSVHLLALPGGEKEAEALYDKFEKKGGEVLYDDRLGATPGEKLVDADLLGIPTRIVVSARTLEQGSVEVKKRNEEQQKLLKLDEITP